LLQKNQEKQRDGILESNQWNTNTNLIVGKCPGMPGFVAGIVILSGQVKGIQHVNHCLLAVIGQHLLIRNQKIETFDSVHQGTWKKDCKL
jgi:hypothetical protein